MISDRPGGMKAVPTLTEEVHWPGEAQPVDVGPAAEPAAAAEPSNPVAVSAPERRAASVDEPAAPVVAAASMRDAAAVDESQLTEQILIGLLRQVDLSLEYRVREMLTPMLARVTDALVRETRGELSRTLREIVARAVADELRRQRTRQPER